MANVGEGLVAVGIRRGEVIVADHIGDPISPVDGDGVQIIGVGVVKRAGEAELIAFVDAALAGGEGGDHRSIGAIRQVDGDGLLGGEAAVVGRHHQAVGGRKHLKVQIPRVVDGNGPGGGIEGKGPVAVVVVVGVAGDNRPGEARLVGGEGANGGAHGGILHHGKRLVGRNLRGGIQVERDVARGVAHSVDGKVVGGARHGGKGHPALEVRAADVVVKGYLVEAANRAAGIDRQHRVVKGATAGIDGNGACGWGRPLPPDGVVEGLLLGLAQGADVRVMDGFTRFAGGPYGGAGVIGRAPLFGGGEVVLAPQHFPVTGDQGGAKQVLGGYGTHGSI